MVWFLTMLTLRQADEIKAADENARRAADDCQRLQEELRRAQTDSNNLDKLRRNLASQCKELQGRLDEAEAARATAGKRQIATLEAKVLFFGKGLLFSIDDVLKTLHKSLMICM